MDGVWIELRRRKNNTRPHGDANLEKYGNDLTNYYMTRFPDGTRKEELRKPFSGFGNVVDVYFDDKKDCYKSFAFVRYLKVDDAKLLEEKLQEKSLSPTPKIHHLPPTTMKPHPPYRHHRSRKRIEKVQVNGWSISTFPPPSILFPFFLIPETRSPD
ncbi:unnamed protein product [Lactuca saligna]|uniref:RRM domain-containing protein n=1 Tax=Lactuca saligna TaxID=75948 RepID=A0AA35Y2Z1_LACSI|nr:unnamed protein product [Lactuca saligna]